MSVAFRREGDEEHLEPKFEIPIPSGPNLVTKRGLALITARIADLEARLKQDGDEARAKSTKRDLRYWQTRQITAELAAQPAGDLVEFGTTVVFMHDGRRRELSIVGDDEADPASNLISFAAPLSRALLGAEAGEFLDFGGKEGALEVLSISIIAPDA